MNLSEIKSLLRDNGWVEHSHKWFVWTKLANEIIWSAHIGSIPRLPKVSPFAVYISQGKELGNNYTNIEQLTTKILNINNGKA